MSSENINFYKLKYLKYKNKYFDLKKMIGSGNCAISGQCTKSETAKLRHKYSEVNNDEQINTTTKGRATKEAQAAQEAQEAKRRAVKKAQEVQEAQEAKRRATKEAQEAQAAKRRATKEAKEAQEAQEAQEAKRRATKEAQEAQEVQEAQEAQEAKRRATEEADYFLELRNLRNLKRAEEEAIKTPQDPKSIEVSEKLCENKFKELYEYFKNNYSAILKDISTHKIDSRFVLQVLTSNTPKYPDARWELLYIKDIDKSFVVSEVLKNCRNDNSKFINIIRGTILILQQDFL